MTENTPEVRDEVVKDQPPATTDATDAPADDSAAPIKKHKLHRSWTMWYDAPTPGKKQDPSASWHDNIKKIVSFRNVEDFWSLFNNLMAPSKLAVQSNYHLFKEGVMPAWEDPQNKEGGKWALQLNTSEKKLLDEIWLYTILDVIGESFEESDEICGIVISLRKSRNRISLWTKNSNNEVAQRRIGKEFKEKLLLSHRHKLSYSAHSTAYTRGAKPLYEI